MAVADLTLIFLFFLSLLTLSFWYAYVSVTAIICRFYSLISASWLPWCILTTKPQGKQMLSL